MQRHGFAAQSVDIACAAAGLALLGVAVSIHMDPLRQVVLAVATGAAFLVANTFKSHRASVFLAMLSTAVSARYLTWRVTETLNPASAPELVFGVGLILAELQMAFVLVLGYVQALWPRPRKPVELPRDAAAWPTVDILISIHDEPMGMVRTTVLGALGVDWPRDRMSVVLLDGGRADVAAFADECGVRVITGSRVPSVKFGRALDQTRGEMVALLDCGHIPTCAFLQMTVGWIVSGPRNALVQTPHHCGRKGNAPGGREAFADLLQHSNDFWNAALFSFSCAVLRRAALEQVGGFAAGTDPDGMRTTIRMHRLGWRGAYLPLPLTAGLAAERSAARGDESIRMARTGIPWSGRGLTLGQRFCHLRARVPFLFAIPRIAALAAPLAFLLFGQSIIVASPLAAAAYALPHFCHAAATHRRLQRGSRHPLWNGLRRTALALRLARATALLFPRWELAYDGAVLPDLVLPLLLAAGIIRGGMGMAVPGSGRITDGLLLNILWGACSLATILMALAVGWDVRQRAGPVLSQAAVTVAIHLPGGQVSRGVIRDLSQSGASVFAAAPDGVTPGMPCGLEFIVGGEPVLVPSRLIRWGRRCTQVSFQPRTIGEEAAVVRAVYGRADAWVGNADPATHGVASLRRALASVWAVADQCAPVAGQASRDAGQRPPALGRRRRGFHPGSASCGCRPSATARCRAGGTARLGHCRPPPSNGVAAPVLIVRTHQSGRPTCIDAGNPRLGG
jgi:cellulose synthase (UDP-forming)